jgi:hypothetical protein
MHIPQPIHAEVTKEHTYGHRPFRKKENALIIGKKYIRNYSMPDPSWKLGMLKPSSEY